MDPLDDVDAYVQDANVKFRGLYEFVDSLNQEQLESFKEFIYSGITMSSIKPDALGTWLNYWNGISSYRLLKDFGVKPWDEKIDFNEEDAKKLTEGP